MTHSTIRALVVASMASALVAAALVVATSGPSSARPVADLDPSAVSAAVQEAMLSVFRRHSPTPLPRVRRRCRCVRSGNSHVAFSDSSRRPDRVRLRHGGDSAADGRLGRRRDRHGGVYDQASATVDPRNESTAGPANLTYVIGVPGDVPLAGDFDDDGIDTVAA